MGLNIQDLKITSPDFEFGGWLDDRHANPSNTAPTLTIEGIPAEAQELAVICHDPDAPLPHGFTHWVVYGIPTTVGTVDASADEKFRTATNGTGSTGYFGPEPPPGHGPHHYYFWVYALDTQVSGEPSREEFLDRYGDHIIEQNRVVGRYEN